MRPVPLLAVGVFGALVFFAAPNAVRKFGRTGVFCVVLALMLSVRGGYAWGYSPYRSQARSVKGIAQKVHKAIPQGASIYNIELFQRWVTYYLKQLGRKTLRVSQEVAQAKAGDDSPVYLFVDAQEESWRLDQLKLYDFPPEIIGQYQVHKDTYYLMQVPGRALIKLSPKELIPTTPSLPFYAELGLK
jgi:hypothetical protein